MRPQLLIFLVLFLLPWSVLDTTELSESVVRDSDGGELRPVVRATQAAPPAAPPPAAPPPTIATAETPPAVPVENDRLVTPDEEFGSIIKDLQQLAPADQVYARYVSFYSLPRVIGKIGETEPNSQQTLREIGPGVFLFTANSVAAAPIEGGPGVFGYYHELTHDPDIVRIDLRDFGWTPEAWDKLLVEQPYYLPPFVSETNFRLGVELAGGLPLVRADWFIRFAWVDPGYSTLIYPKNGPPANEAEFFDRWLVRLDDVYKAGAEKRFLVDEDSSMVTFHNRRGSRAVGVYGPSWFSSDVIESIGQRDLVENLLDGAIIDAREYVQKRGNRLQVYLLTARDNAGQKEADAEWLKADAAKDFRAMGELLKAVPFADPNVARDNNSGLRQRLVTTGYSCAVCHDVGILFPTGYSDTGPGHFVEKMIQSGVQLKGYAKGDQQKIERFYLSDIQGEIVRDQADYAAAVMELTGWEASVNARNLRRVVTWYDGKLSAEQAARECGYSVTDWRLKVGPSALGRLQALVHDIDMGREVWGVHGGAYQAAQLTIYGEQEIWLEKYREKSFYSLPSSSAASATSPAAKPTPATTSQPKPSAGSGGPTATNGATNTVSGSRYGSVPSVPRTTPLYRSR